MCDQGKYFNSSSSELRLVYRGMLNFCSFDFLKKVRETVSNILGENFYSINTDEK